MIQLNNVAKENMPKKFSTCVFSTYIYNLKNGVYEKDEELEKQKQKL